MRKHILLSLFLILFGLSAVVHGQDQHAALQKKLDGFLVLTKATADNSDIVTPGSVVVLHRDGLQMCSTQAKLPFPNAYKNGKVGSNKFAWSFAMGMAQPDLPAATVPLRTFVTGEKFWVTSLSAEKNGIIIKVISDPFQDVRYYAALEIPYNKKAMQTDDELLKSVAELITVDGAPEAAAPAGPAAPPAPAAPASYAPVPPPSDPAPAAAAPASTKTVSLGQTKDQVIAILGQPGKSAIIGEKEMLIYPDMKVILIKGKVTDIQ